MWLEALADEVLVARARAGDDRAFEDLARRYHGLIGFLTRWPPPGVAREDLRQEALIGLFEACRAHDPSQGGFERFAGRCIRHRVWGAVRNAGRAKQRVLTDAVGLDHRDGPAGDGEELTIAERLRARDGVDPAVVVELRERLGELGAALRVLTPRYREALLCEDGATAKRRCHARRRLARLLERGISSTPARVDGRRYSDEQVQRAVALVSDGRTLREAGAVVGAPHTTVMRWVRKAA